MIARKAVVDIGSNSIKYLVADCSQSGFEVVASKVAETRISSGISAKMPMLQDSAITAARLTLSEFAIEFRQLGVVSIVAVATSAVRDAANKAAFCAMVRQVLGVELMVLSGDEEADLIARGVATDPEIQHLKDFLLFDLGGGSLELARYERGSLQARCSLQLGAVRLKELFVTDPDNEFTSTELTQLDEHIETMLNQPQALEVWRPQIPLVGLGGAVAVTATMLQCGNTIQADALTELLQRSASLPLSQRKLLSGLPPQRADIIVPALLVIRRLLTITQNKSLHISFHNLRYGLLTARQTPVGEGLPRDPNRGARHL